MFLNIYSLVKLVKKKIVEARTGPDKNFLNIFFISDPTIFTYWNGAGTFCTARTGTGSYFQTFIPSYSQGILRTECPRSPV